MARTQRNVKSSFLYAFQYFIFSHLLIKVKVLVLDSFISQRGDEEAVAQFSFLNMFKKVFSQVDFHITFE